MIWGELHSLKHDETWVSDRIVAKLGLLFMLPPPLIELGSTMDTKDNWRAQLSATSRFENIEKLQVYDLVLHREGYKAS